MFEGDLTELDTGTLLSVGAEFRALEDRAAVRQLEVALAFADRYPDPRADADTGYGAGFGEAPPGTERGRGGVRGAGGVSRFPRGAWPAACAAAGSESRRRQERGAEPCLRYFSAQF